MRVYRPWSVGLFALVSFAALVACVKAPLTFDEKTFYVPAIHSVARLLPHLALADLPLPGPPGWLLLQATMCRSMRCDAWFLRLPSVVMWLALGAVLFRFKPLGILLDDGRRGACWVLLFFPYFLRDSVRLTAHIAAAVLSILALLMMLGEATGPRLRRVFWAGGFLLAAAACEATVAALAVFLLAEAISHLLHGRRGQGLEGVLVAAPALCLYGFLVAVWGGLQSPAFLREFPSIRPSALGQVWIYQLLMGAFVIGVWLVPVVRVGRARWRLAAFLFPPLAGLMWTSRVFRAPIDFETSFAGIGSEILRRLSFGSVGISSILAGAIAALGVAFLAVPTAANEELCRVRGFAVAYLGMMLLVPFLFERYYLLFVSVAYFMIRRSISEDGRAVPILFRQAAIAVLGVGFAFANWFLPGIAH